MNKLFSFARLAHSYFNGVSQNLLYYFFKIEPVRYSNAVFLINTQCNSRCAMCSSYTIKPLPGEMTTEQVIDTLNKLKKHNSNIKISFVGGEPTLRPDFDLILGHCNKLNIIFTIVTNGIILNENKAENILLHKPFAVHVSLDSLDKDTYKKIRGVDRVESVKTNINILIQIAKKLRSKTFIGIKTVITSENINEISNLSDFAQSVKAGGIHYQPVLVFSEDHGSARLMPKQSEEINKQVNILLERIKNNNKIILNSISNLKSWTKYFEGSIEKRRFCSTSMQNIFIMSDGKIKLCERYDETIGNILNYDSIDSIIKNNNAIIHRKMMTSCQRHCSFIFSRGIKDYISLVIRHIRN
ncbi:radical SAM protein [Methylobacillus arboreus]|uniref:radical SAM protein n=1 Tax=Methylobacillus arboreus TaxID=755170 RepID=UPI001E4173F1|nr:radical SAM protein [Methylobacillus arboreus]MCB5189672.1 radical SAM protein [Methylobacillus arboreus]